MRTDNGAAKGQKCLTCEQIIIQLSLVPLEAQLHPIKNHQSLYVGDFFAPSFVQQDLTIKTGVLTSKYLTSQL